MKNEIFIDEDLVPLDGTQIHVNHFRCPAGEDTRKRLYIKRDGDVILAYCHNCGGSSAYKNYSSTSRYLTRDFDREDYDRLVADAPLIVDTELALPDGYDTPLNRHAQSWKYCHESGLSESTINKSAIYYSDSLDRMIIPIKDAEEKQLIYWQGRSFNPAMPKYINVKGVSKPLFVLKNTQHREHPNRTILVEDAISAWRIWQDCDMANTQIIALLGTKVDTADLLPYVEGGRRAHHIIVWLDEDVAGRQATVELQPTLVALGKHVSGVDVSKYPQPKRCVDQKQLSEALKIKQRIAWT